MSDVLRIELTDEQKVALEPCFEAVRDACRNGIGSAIGAQIYGDAMVVKVFSGPAGKALSSALRGDWNLSASSADERLGRAKGE